jgi:non-specific serine/threonine protein kinase
MFWRTHGYLNQGRAALDLALEADTSTPAHRADALFAAAEICEWQRDHATSAKRALAAQALYQELNDQRGVAMTLQLLGHSHVGRGQASIPPDQTCFIQAKSCFEQELALFQKLEFDRGIAWATESLGIVAQNQEQFALAVAYFQRALELYERAGDYWGTGWAMTNLAAVMIPVDDRPGAMDLFVRALDVFVDIGDRWATIQVVKNVALLGLQGDQAALAVRILAAATAFREADGIELSMSEAASHQEHISRAKRELNESGFEQAWSTGSTMLLDDVVIAARGMKTSFADMLSSRSREPDDLTSREHAVLRLLMEGRTDREIAEALSISHRTVNGHVAHLLAKLGAETRTAAAAIAIRNGIV